YTSLLVFYSLLASIQGFSAKIKARPSKLLPKDPPSPKKTLKTYPRRLASYHQTSNDRVLQHHRMTYI
ncbi:hypothetical protein, partial [Bartonella sp. CL74QHWL]|uniref:hypothetical protein n=1 Tax=Bartonella sp. CL74QHWL TaxID=3243541 RepID=UPI0035D0FC1D